MEGLIHKASRFEVKESNDDARTVKGYASYFGNLDTDMDVIKKGAFKKTIKEGPFKDGLVKLWAQHKMDKPIGVIKNLYEDEKGLVIEATFGTHRDGEDYYRMTKEGIIDRFSVGFQKIQGDRNEKGGYDITEIKLWEVSMVTIPANQEAKVTDVKSAHIDNTEVLIKQVEDKELAFKLQHELLKLKSALLNESTTEPTLEKDTQPELEEKDLELDLLTQLKKSFK